MGGRRKKVQSVKLWNAIRKYGIDSWTHEVLLVTENEQEAATQEIILIEQFNTFQNGYNTTTGGDGYRAKHCDKTKKKIGEAARISAARMRDEERHRKRSPHTVETKMKMRMAALRRYNHV